MLKTLLLNSSYEAISFIPLRNLIKLVIKDKVDVVSVWGPEEEDLTWCSGKIRYPSVIKMKYYVKRNPHKTRFNRRGIFKRDMFSCMYCGNILSAAQLTIDHVIPKSQGGRNSWVNCVTCCLACNTKKGNRSLEQAGMKLLVTPTEPINPIVNEFMLIKPRHPDWEQYFSHIITLKHNKK